MSGSGEKRKAAGKAAPPKRRPSPTSDFPSFDPAPSGSFAGRVLEESGARGALIGRLAIWAWLPDPSQQVFTKDMGVAIVREHMRAVRKWFLDRGKKVFDLSIGGLHYREKVRTKTVAVDFIDRTQEGDFSALFTEAVEAAFRAEERVTIGGAALPVVAPEYLVAMKLIPGTHKDWNDAKMLLQGKVVDVSRARSIVEKHLGRVVLNTFEQLLRDVGHPEATEIGPSRQGERYS